MLITLSLLLGCTRREPYILPTTTDTAGDTAADSVPASFQDVSHEMSKDIGAVAIVTFSAAGSGAGVVRFGPEGDAGQVVAASDLGGGRWRAVLVGVPAGAAGWYTVGLGDTFDATRHTYTAGPAPGWVTAEHEGTAQNEGFLVLAFTGETRGAAIFTTDGEPVWWWASDGELLIRAALSPARDAVWFNRFTIEPAASDRDQGAIVKVALDGSSEEILSLPKSHHDFVVRDDGALVLPVLEDREIDGTIVRGDTLVEIAPDGSERTIWSAWDALPYGGESGFPEGWWTMLNHIQHAAADDDYVFSLKNISSLARVDGGSGATEWVIGGTHETLVPDVRFSKQHGLHVVDSRHLWVFDNDGGPDFSRVLQFELDPDAGTATVVESYSDELTSFVMGDVLQHDDGNVTIAWSTACTIDEVSDGVRVSRLTFPEANTVGYITFAEQIGPSPP